MEEDSPAPTSTFNTLFWAPQHMKLLQVVTFGEEWQVGTCLYGFLLTLPPLMKHITLQYDYVWLVRSRLASRGPWGPT